MKKRTLGFTLIELMVTVAIVAILLAMAVPSFSKMIKANRVQSQMRELYSQLAYARSEAVSRSNWVTICSSSNGTSCGGTWSNGWIVCVDPTHTNNCSQPVLRVYNDMGTNTLTVVDDATPAVARDHLSFSKSGQADIAQSMTFAICDVDKDVTFARAIFKVNAGQVVYAMKNNATGVYKDVKGGDLTCP